MLGRSLWRHVAAVSAWGDWLLSVTTSHGSHGHFGADLVAVVIAGLLPASS